MKDAKHIVQFMQEYKVIVNSYIICRTPRAFNLTENIIVLPWQDLANVFTVQKN